MRILLMVSVFLICHELQAGEREMKQVFVRYKGEYRLVVGAKDSSPVIRMENDELKAVSSSRFTVQLRHAPVAGEVKILEADTVYGGKDPSHRYWKFIPDRDYDNLYLVIFFTRASGNELVAVQFQEIGSVRAGEVHKAYCSYKRGKGIQVAPRFYHNGLIVEVNRKDATSSIEIRCPPGQAPLCYNFLVSFATRLY
jgi:hypothetical protein